jgi:O-antigen/teichoic acid export membrane protein
MSSASVGVARGILRNASALFLVGVFAKGAGLIIAILVARFLGAGAMGLFAMLFSIAILLETFISLGLSDSLVRDVAARPADAGGLYFSALRLVVKISVVPAALLGGAAFLVADAGAARSSLLVIAAGAPISGAFVVSQAVLQGREQVALLTWVAFFARLVSLAALGIALYFGAGLEAAFASRLLFEGLAVAAFFIALRRDMAGEHVAHGAGKLLRRSAPFAVSLALRDMGMRLASFVLPGLVGFAPSGVFDSANRIRGTLGMTMAVSITGLMPSFARSLGPQASAGSGGLVAYSVKYMCLGMAAIATGIALLSHWVVQLFFGGAFAEAAVPLQILAWAQVLVAMDAVLQQAMLASGHAFPAIRRTAVGLAMQLALLWVLVRPFGLPGAAHAVLLASAVALALDLAYVVRSVTAFPVARFALAPLAAAATVAIVLRLCDGLPFLGQLFAAIAAWAVAIPVLRVLPREEMRFIAHLASPGRVKHTDDHRGGE